MIQPELGVKYAPLKSHNNGCSVFQPDKEVAYIVFTRLYDSEHWGGYFDMFKADGTTVGSCSTLGCIKAGGIRPYSSSPSLIMSVVNFLKDKARSPEDRALIRAGFTDDCGNLTCEGEEALQSLLFAEFKPQLVTLAKEMVAEQEKAKKCCK